MGGNLTTALKNKTKDENGGAVMKSAVSRSNRKMRKAKITFFSVRYTPYKDKKREMQRRGEWSEK